MTKVVLKKPKSNPFFVYILRCADTTLYIGSTNNLEKRLHTHNNLKSGARYTKSRRPVVLVYQKKYKNKSVAYSHEALLKQLSKLDKEKLIVAHTKK